MDLGVELDPGDTDSMFEVIRNFHPIQTSMLWDIEHRRPFELEAVVGLVVREGRKLGVPTPVNDVVYALLRGRLRSLVG